ncbi:hypothetical protein VTJ83DRAFT_293 [Remersonia thermophila]|uniref:Zinc finger C2H2 LYAR-type domain-containing protein n=1 Tax=Remersonia thermophila TaxID=72144 RepID=A0ABR4DKT0_9PEZI
MVSFSCEACGDVLTKKKLDPHRNRCYGATFTCIDCMTYFPGTQYRAHTSCISEAQKYQGALYREKKPKGQQAPAQNQNNQPAPAKNQNRQPQNQNHQPAPDAMAHTAYVEDAQDEDRHDWRRYRERNDSDDDDDQSFKSFNRMPEAPSPPPAVPDESSLNVFDFLVNNPTPTASHVSLPATAQAPPQPSENNQLVRFEPEENDMTDVPEDDQALMRWGSGSGSAPNGFETPAPKEARRKMKDVEKESSSKKDKKRKRLHIDVTDHPMTDAPPTLHTGLTGGLSRMMSKSAMFPLPPSPASYESGDAEGPASPLKKSKSKHHRSSRGNDTLGMSLMTMLAGGSKPKSASSSKKRAKTKSSSTPSKTKKKKRSSTSGTKAIDAPKEPKLLEFRPVSKDGKGEGDESSALIIYKPPAEHFLSFVNKGPDSIKGCSVNKALKRYHRERSASGASSSKLDEEKELWRSLRMKRNERGEIVLFSLDS